MLETGPQKLGRQQHRHQSPQAERALSNSVLDSAFFKLHFGFFGPSCALGSLLQAVHVIFGLNSLKTRYIAHGEMK